MNQPNFPQARPIERFWGNLAQKVYERGWEDTTVEELIRRIKYKINDLTRIIWKPLWQVSRQKSDLWGRMVSILCLNN